MLFSSILSLSELSLSLEMESKWTWNLKETKNDFLNSKELTAVVIPQILDSKIDTK